MKSISLFDCPIAQIYNFFGCIVAHRQGKETEKIYDNTINRNLEQVAHQLYDYWFIQFDFPNHEGKPYKSSGGEMVWNEALKRCIPIGWKDCFISDVEADIVTGKTPSTSDETNFGEDIPFVTIDDIRGHYFVFETSRNLSLKGADAQSSKYLPKGSLFCSCIGTPGVIGFAGTKVQTNQQINSIRFKHKSNAVFLYYGIKLYFSYANAKIGNILPNMSKGEFEKILIVYPGETIIRKFDDLISPVFNEIEINSQSIISLLKMRDELLPMLLNGQVNCDLYYIKGSNLITIAMKEKIIEMVMNGMIDCLTGAQLERLQGVLHITLQGVDVSSVCYDEQVNHDNEVLLASFLSAKSIEGCSGKTIAYYRMTISRFLNLIEKDLRLVCTDDIRSYLTMYQQEHGSSMVTIDNMRRIFSSFFSWLEDEDYIVKSPVRRIHKVRTEKLVKETISDEQLETLRDSCEEMRDLAMIDFLASTGVRVGELVKINRDDIDFHERQCVVLGKGNKERTVYFNARAKVHLQKYLAERDDDNEALFVRLNGKHERMSIGGIEARMRWLGSQAEVCRIHPHKFRRTMATVAIDKGMPIEQVQRLLGHKKIDTTLHYAMVNQNNVKIAHRKYIS